MDWILSVPVDELTTELSKHPEFDSGGMIYVCRDSESAIQVFFIESGRLDEQQLDKKWTIVSALNVPPRAKR